MPDGKTSLHFTFVNPNVEVTSYLFNIRKLNPNKSNNYEIFWVIKQNGTFVTILLLILFGTDTDRINTFGNNMLKAMQIHDCFALIPKVQEIIKQ